MKVTAVFQDTARGWGSRMASFLEENSPAAWQFELKELPAFNIPVIDNPEEFLPRQLPEAELLIALVETNALGQLVPDLARLAGAESLLIPVDFERGLPSGLQKQLKDELEEMEIAAALPEPFCSLTPTGYEDELIREFASHFGRPELVFRAEDGELLEIEVERSSPCGGSHFVAEELMGVELEEASQKAGLAHQYYPCMASVDIIHRSAHITEAAVKRARRECCQQDDSIKPTSQGG